MENETKQFSGQLEYFVDEEIVKSGNVLAEVAKITGVPFWKLKKLNGYPLRSDFILGKKVVILLGEIGEI